MENRGSPLQTPDPSQPALPDPGGSRLIASPFGIDEIEAQRIAKEVAETHRKQKRGKYQRDLTAEKYLLHVDGEGDAQWADIVQGTRVEVPPNISGGLRWQWNLLGPLVANAIAYHTAQKYQVTVQPKGDRESRNKARIDTIWANDLIKKQRLNQVIAEALFFAACYGHCPVHALWREDNSREQYEPLYATGQQGPQGQQEQQGQQEPQGPRAGYVDIYTGDPWDTVYNNGARRHSVQWLQYGRVVPTMMLRDHFQHVPGIDELEGRTDLPSGSRYQRIARKWGTIRRMTHGTGVIWGGQEGDELTAVVCREIAPGVMSDYPEGRLTIAALSGAADTDEETIEGHHGKPMLLHDGPLPGGRFSCVRVYMSNRGDDVLGAPWIGPIDDLQVQLNQLVTHRAEFIRRFARPPFLVQAGTLVDDTITTEDDAILEITGGSIKPGYQYPPADGIKIFETAINETMDQMFRIGGWQAASRGESSAGDPAAKIVALARADDTVFGPVNNGIRESIVEVLQLGHALTKERMDVPMVVNEITGEDRAYLASPYIHATELSDDPPQFHVVSASGATPEARGQQLISLVQLRGADNTPLMDTDDFWRMWPDQSIRPTEVSSKAMKEHRAQTILEAITSVGQTLRQQMGKRADLFTMEAHRQILDQYPMLPTDPPPLHIETLDQLIHDESEDPLPRRIAQLRQGLYIERLKAEAAPQMGMAGGNQGPPEHAQGQQQAGPPQAAQAVPGAPTNAGTPSSEAMSPRNISGTVDKLTEAAKRGAV